MTSERRHGARVFLAIVCAIGAAAYGYAFLLETPGQVSSLGLIALATGSACLLVIVSYVLVRWHHARFASGDKVGTVKGRGDGT